MLIRLQCIYNFWLFHAIILSILDVLQSFIVILYYFLVLTYWHSAKCSCCFFHVFYITENQYQTESKCHETLRRFFMDQKTRNGSWLHLGGAPRRAQPTRARQEAQARPGGLCPPRVPPEPPICSINTPIFQKPYGSRRKSIPTATKSRTTDPI